MIRDITVDDYPAILRLNDASVAETSALDLASLTRLVAMSSYFRASLTGANVDGFLIGLREDASYANDNFRWFRERHERFLYVDRIIIDRASRGRGLGSALYEDLERHARAAGADLLACEVNVVPENRPSMAFHTRLGFVEVGRRPLQGGGKTVAMLVRRL